MRKVNIINLEIVSPHQSGLLHDDRLLQEVAGAAEEAVGGGETLSGDLTQAGRIVCVVW